MNDQTLPHFVGLDIGTSMVRCIVGTPDNNELGKISIVGYGSAPNTGMRKGVVIYGDEVADAIHEVITEAERVSGIKIRNATVNINGSHVLGMNSKGVIAISTANREITESDRDRVEDAATIVKLPPNREIVQVFAKNYKLDGQGNIKDPVGMHGVRLEVDTHIVTASVPSLRSLDEALAKAQIIPNRHTVSSLASVEAVLNRQQKESGTILIDIGHSTTNLVVIEDGEVQHVAVIPIGGVHITNDLAIGLKTDLDIAEKIKVEHASLTGDLTKKENIRVDVNKSSHNFKTADIEMIVEARVDEIMDYVDKELHKIQRSRKLPGGAVLVGGTSKLPGIEDFTKEKLQLPARIGKLHNVSGFVDSANDPSMFTAIGLMLLDMLLEPAHPSAELGMVTNTKILGSISKLWKSVKS